MAPGTKPGGLGPEGLCGGDMHVLGLSSGPGVYTQHFNPPPVTGPSRGLLLPGAEEVGVAGGDAGSDPSRGTQLRTLCKPPTRPRVFSVTVAVAWAPAGTARGLSLCGPQEESPVVTNSSNPAR